MSQIALIEINKKIKDIFKDDKFTIDGKTFLSFAPKNKLDFLDVTKTYINILNDYESNELDMLLFDYKIDLNDFDKIFEIISPLFDLIIYLINKYKINPNEIKLFISEDCNVKYNDFIKININLTNAKESFIRYFANNDILKINCFPPIVFCFK